MKYKGDYILCSAPNDDWGERKAREYIKAMGLSRHQVKLLKREDEIVVKVIEGVEVELPK